MNDSCRMVHVQDFFQGGRQASPISSEALFSDAVPCGFIFLDR
jgi:hypothetical protein